MTTAEGPETTEQVIPLRAPGTGGFLDPHAVLRTVVAVEHALGDDAVKQMLQEARLHRLPAPDEPVREAKVRQCHDAIRKLWPDRAPALLSAAGEGFAAEIRYHRMTARARQLLSAAPWPLAAWLIGQRLRQMAWSVAGSGTLSLETAMVFEIRGNPLARGLIAAGPACHFHTAFFASLFGTLVDSRLTARETTCIAAGDSACRFSVGLREG